MDEIDTNRAQVHVMMYMMASIQTGMVKVHPQVHGIYETWQAAETARQSKSNPGEYSIVTGSWSKM